MSRRLASGTPTRADGYVFPGSGRRRLLGALATGVGVAAILIGLWLAGANRALSPGPVIAAHAPFEADCALCHDIGATVVDIRCERCHDAAETTRLTNQAHVLFGSRDARKAARAESIACAECHTDHRGRRNILAATDDRRCGTCHEFSRLSGHPEFAAVIAGVQTGLGLRFPHERHLVDVRSELGTECAACHVPTPNLVGFEPISFDRHCASCHAPDGFITGKTDRMAAELIVLESDVPEPWRQPGLLVEASGAPNRRRVEAANLVHRDPWVLYNAMKLGREIDPEAERAEIATLQAQLAWLEQQPRESPLRALTPEQLNGVVASLTVQIGDLERRVAAVATASDAGDGLQAMLAGARALASAIDAQGLAGAAASTAGSDSLLDALGALQADLEAAGAVEPPDDGQAAERFERRRDELLALLEAIRARGDAAVEARADDLAGQVAALQPEPSVAPVDAEALQRQLDRLDEPLRALDGSDDPQGRLGAAQVAGLRDLAGRRVGGGLAPGEFSSRRAELLELLDAIERRGGGALTLRVAQLRQAVLGLRVGEAGDGDLERRLAATRRLLERARLEQELRAAGVAGSGGARIRPLAVGAQRDLAAIESATADLRRRLADLRGGPRGSAAVGAEGRRARQATLSALFKACLKCHELPTTRLAPVRIAEPVMRNSVFDHAPHVAQVDCATCHGDPTAADAAGRRVFASKLASDVNLPGVLECAACHNGADVSNQCETCHRYHPPSVGGLLGLR